MVVWNKTSHGKFDGDCLTSNFKIFSKGENIGKFCEFEVKHHIELNFGVLQKKNSSYLVFFC